MKRIFQWINNRIKAYIINTIMEAYHRNLLGARDQIGIRDQIGVRNQIGIRDQIKA